MAITLLEVKTNLTTSANLTRTILFHRKIFLKYSPKNACYLIKLAQKTQPAAIKNFPQCNEKAAQLCGKTAQLATLLCLSTSSTIV